MLLLALVASTSATRLAAAGTFCAVTHYPNPPIALWCDGSTTVSEVAFADWGLSTADPCGHYTPNASCTCAAAASQLVRRLCLCGPLSDTFRYNQKWPGCRSDTETLQIKGPEM
eukprot:COSAG01_NODE_20932_length_927_cov_0.900966_2_plen_113_part_01